MAQIVKQVAQEGLNPGSAPTVRVSNALAEAVQGLGGAVSNLGSAYQKRAAEKENFNTENAYRKFKLDTANGMAEEAKNMAPDGTGYHDSFVSKVLKPNRDKFLAGVPERLKEKYSTILADDTGADFTEWSIKAAELERDQTYKWADGEIVAHQDELMKSIETDPDNFEKYLQDGIDQVNASPTTTPYKAEKLKSWQRLAEIAKLSSIIKRSPERALMEMGADSSNFLPDTQFSILSKALTAQESGGDPNAISQKGAIGLMQVMPGTAREIAKELGDPTFNQGWSNGEIVDYLSNPTVNREYGEHYLRKMIRLYGRQGGIEAALIGYNGGPARAEAWIRSGRDDSVIPQESADYYKKVLGRIEGWKPQAAKGDPSGVKIVFAGEQLDRAKKFGSTPGEAGVDPDLIQRVKTAYAALGVQEVKANSGHRNESHNKAAGGAEKSQHMGPGEHGEGPGKAIDLNVTGWSIPRKLALLQSLSANGVGGIGVGDTIIHVDMGARRAWGYNRPSGGGAVPDWALPVIQPHLEGKTQAPATGNHGGYKGLTYADREKLIAEANQGVALQYKEMTKFSVVEKADLKSAMNNEAANIMATGRPSGTFDDLKVNEVLGEDAYANWMDRKDFAVRLHGATDGLETMSSEQMVAQLNKYTPTPGTPTFLKDQEVYTAVEKQKEKIEKLRSTEPDKGALLFDDVKQAYAKVSAPGVEPLPEDVQKFVELMLEKQKSFNLKPGSEAPVPHDWAMEIGKSLARVPELAGKNLKDVNAGITAQYKALQQMFGPYTEEVIMYALAEYHGVGPNTAKLITGYMQSIEAGGDPLKLKPRDIANAKDRDAMEQISGKGFWGNAKDFWNGTRSEDEPADGEDFVPSGTGKSGGPRTTTAPAAPGSDLPGLDGGRLTPEDILRLDEKVSDDLSPEDEAALIEQYGEAAVSAAKLRKQAQ